MNELHRLEDVVDQLRLELKVLQNKALSDEEALVFEVIEAELEFQVVVTKGAEGGAKVNVWVAELGGAGNWSRENTQALRLKLRPRVVEPKAGSGGGGEVLIGRER